MLAGMAAPMILALASTGGNIHAVANALGSAAGDHVDTAADVSRAVDVTVAAPAVGNGLTSLVPTLACLCSSGYSRLGHEANPFVVLVPGCYQQRGDLFMSTCKILFVFAVVKCYIINQLAKHKTERDLPC